MRIFDTLVKNYFGWEMSGEVKTFFIKLFLLIILSPLIGYLVVAIVENIERARKKKKSEKLIALTIVGFLVGILLGWLQ